MKNIFPLIIFLMILASFFRQGGIFFILISFVVGIWALRKMSAAAKSKDPEKAQALKHSLRSAFAEIREQLEQQADAGRREKETGWEQVMTIEPEPQDTSEAGPDRMPPSAPPKPAAPPPGKTMKRERKSSERAQRLETLRQRHRKPEVAPPQPLPKAQDADISVDLEKALIWSEILAPPLALRDN